MAKQINTEAIFYTNESIAAAVVVSIEQDKFFVVSEIERDVDSIKEDLLKDLDYQIKFLESLEKKLSNERFVQNAKPGVLALEQKKKADALARIKTIEESLDSI